MLWMSVSSMEERKRCWLKIRRREPRNCVRAKGSRAIENQEDRRLYSRECLAVESLIVFERLGSCREGVLFSC